MSRLILCLAMLSSVAAFATDISGEWSGSAKGLSYHKQQNGDMGSENKVEQATGNLKATITQTGSILNIVMEISPSGDVPFTVELIGNVGNLACWGVGQYLRTDGLDRFFISGHFTAKADKIVGSIIVYSDHEVIPLTYSMKKSAGAKIYPSEPASTARATPRADDVTPFNVSGTVAGKNYVLSGSAKPGAFTGTVTGTIDPVAKTATFKVTAGGSDETFTVSQIDGGKGLAFTGDGQSESIMLAGPVGKDSASGTGWIYSATRMAEFKFKIKKQ